MGLFCLPIRYARARYLNYVIILNAAVDRSPHYACPEVIRVRIINMINCQDVWLKLVFAIMFLFFSIFKLNFY